MFSASSLSEPQALLVAEAYFKSGKDPKKMAAHLGIEKFDLDLIRHPLVKRKINALAEKMRAAYSLEDHLDRLEEIRDAAMEAGNLRIALAAELSVGKAAGLYEKIAETAPVSLDADATKSLTTDESKERLAQMKAGGLLPGPAVADELPEDEEF